MDICAWEEKKDTTLYIILPTVYKISLRLIWSEILDTVAIFSYAVCAWLAAVCGYLC